MSYDDAKEILKELGLTGVNFSSLLGKSSPNYFSDFKRWGVPKNIAIILCLAKELLDNKISKERVLELMKKSSENT